MIQSTRISMGLFFKYFLSLTKIDPGQNYISLPSIKSSTHIALLFMVSMGTQKLKAQSFFIFSLLLTLILFCITTLYNENTNVKLIPQMNYLMVVVALFFLNAVIFLFMLMKYFTNKQMYQNQSIAAHVMRALAAEQSEVSPEQRRAICEAFESANNTHGLNLTAHKYPGLRGTLQTASTDCDTIVEAAALLPAFDQAVEGNRHQDDYGSGLGMAEEKFHYYLDLNDRYVYFYEPVNVEYFAMNNWSFLQSGSIGIDRKDIEKVFTGRTVLSSIYQDQRTKQNVMSLLTPVYVAGQLKGIVLLDINKNNLRNIFYTHDRPLLWRFLNVTLTDTDSGRDIIINQSEDNLFQYVSYVHDLPGGIRVSLSIDILYFITSSWKSVLFWILTALILLNMVRMHFRLYQNVSRENISDAMTGLYNRKILTPELEQRLQKLVQSGSSVMFIAIDMDKLKQINDTLGHQEGDLAITLLAQAIKQSIRKSDYAIRLGGDEFCIILVDSTPQIAAQLPERIEKRLQHIAPQKEIGFSSGIYAMKENDTLHDAYKASDERLYVNKQNKNSRS
ncbi:diguanylate cyclase DgcJ [Escherichia coli]